MQTIEIPYSRGSLKLRLKDEDIRAVLVPEHHMEETALSQEEIVKKALQQPIASGRLCDLAESAERVLVITSDHTRPMPSKITLPILLKEIRRKNPDVKVKIIIATGFHRGTTKAEMIDKFGQEMVEREEFIVHDSRDAANMVFKGIMPSGGELWVNSLVDWADLVVSEGFIEPHFFAGFSGGRKGILPGIASEKTVFANHCSRFIDDFHARTGNLEDNPIHRDMLYAARESGLRYILNVALDRNKKIIRAFAGDPEEAHKEGCAFVSRISGIKPVKADIVITSNGGYPLDQNIYQAVKGMTAAEACITDGGVIIMVAACEDGHGGEAFYRWFSESETPLEVLSRIREIPQQETVADQWEAQILARVLTKCSVILVTDRCSPELIRNMHMLHANDLESALSMAEKIVGKRTGITVIPDGVSVIPCI